MATGAHLLNPQLLAWRPKAHKHQLRLLPSQICFQDGPVVQGLVAVDKALQAKLRVAPLPEPRRSLKTVIPCPHPNHPPPEGSSMTQQHFRQFNAGLATQPIPLEPQRPDHPCPIGNHQVSPLNYPAEWFMVAGGHGHLGIKGHHMTTTTDQFFRCAGEVGV